MLETIAVLLIVGVAALFLVRHFYRTASGEESACQCCDANACPVEPGKCPVQKPTESSEPPESR